MKSAQSGLPLLLQKTGTEGSHGENDWPAANSDTPTTNCVTSGIDPTTVNSAGLLDRLRSGVPSATASLAHPDLIQAAYGTKVAGPRRAGRRRALPVLIGVTSSCLL